MNAKVLILGPTFFGYNFSIQRAFDHLGYQTKVVQYDEPVHPFNLKNMMLHKLFPSCKNLREKSRRLFNTFVVGEFKNYQPDFIFIYNGDILERETVRLFRQHSKVAVWMLDGAFRHPDSLAIAPEVNVYFCFEKSDVDKLRSLGINAYFLPQGYDPTVYYPMASKKDIDILFVGALYRYPERIRLLKLAAKELGNTYNMKVYGWYKPIYKNPVKWLFRERRDIFMNKNIPPEEVNKLYNRAKVCINIHHSQSVEGANPKVFEICGAGAYQLVDYNHFITSVYPEGEVGFFYSDRDFIEKIKELMPTDMSAAAQKAHQKVVRFHTFECRIQEAMKVLGV